MYNIPYNDTEANLFFKEHKDKILKAIKEKRGCFTEKIKNETYVFYENDFIKSFLDNYSDEAELRKLITGRPDKLLEIIKTVKKDNINNFEYITCDTSNKLEEEEKEICNTKISNKKRKTKKEKKAEEEIIRKRDLIIARKGIPDFRRMLNRIFVDNIYEKKDFFNKYDFVRKKRLRVCPYCGRSYIFPVVRKGKSNVKPQIDHFIPKGRFPFLAFSYYNLIPSCDSCNTICKKDKKPLNNTNDTYLVPNPYDYEDKPLFQFRLQDLNVFSDFFSGTEQSIQVDFNPQLKKKVLDKYESLFGLKSLYKEHNDIVYDLLIRKQYWASETNQEYYKNILECNPNIKKKMILAFLGYYENPEEHAKRPFSKFLSDISAYYDELVEKGKK